MRKRRLYIFVCISCVLLVCFIVMFSSVFTITAIEITGNNKLSEEYIKRTVDLNSTTNLFAFNSYKAKKALKANLYVEQVEIVKEYPDKLSFKIAERRLSGYVEYMGRYLYIDENGRVLEVATDFTDKLPIIVGLEFDEFCVGQFLEVENKSSFDIVVTLAKLFNKYEMESEIIRVDVKKDDDIHLYIYQVDVEFGDIKDADVKVRYIKEIMEQMPDASEKKGFLDIKNINVAPRFRLLT